MNALELLYQGKAKSAYLTDDPDLLVLQFRDDTSAFDGEIIEQLSEKGAINNQFNAFIMTTPPIPIVELSLRLSDSKAGIP
jgi:phosphoribosylaminoimidazole-succinocarboxamide synthase